MSLDLYVNSSGQILYCVLLNVSTGDKNNNNKELKSTQTSSPQHPVSNAWFFDCGFTGAH